MIQNYIVKVILNKPRLYPSSMLYSRELCSVRALYVITVCTFIHTNTALYPSVIDNSHDFLTRAKLNKMLQIPNSRRDINQRFITYLGLKFYNCIPLDIRNIKKCNKVKNYFYYSSIFKYRYISKPVLNCQYYGFLHCQIFYFYFFASYVFLFLVLYKVVFLV